MFAPRHFHLLHILAAAGVISSALAQGPLTPPGPPNPTQKTLLQIEPRIDLLAATPGPGVISDANNHIIITLPGSYYLSANLTVTKTTGISVDADGVTIDLGGFQIVSGAPGATRGILIQAAATRCLVKNGGIAGGNTFTYGINADPATSAGTYRDLTVSACAIGLNGAAAWRFEGCTAFANSSTGLDARQAASFVNCTASHNGSLGMRGLDSCVFAGCVSDSNSVGFNFGSYCSCSNCTATNCGGQGFNGSSGAAFLNCTAGNNSGAGFLAGDSSVFTNCSAFSNGSGVGSSFGIFSSSFSVLTNCAVRANGGTGISVGLASSVIGCSASGNGTGTNGVGISANSRSLIKDCTASGNLADGILAATDCLIVGNHCLQNGGGNATGVAGIRVTGGENRIEGNAVVENSNAGNSAAGISANALGGAPRNLIFRNTARSNDLNYVISPGNRVARIVAPDANVNQINGANGNNGSGTDGFTGLDPWANFTY